MDDLRAMARRSLQLFEEFIAEVRAIMAEQGLSTADAKEKINQRLGINPQAKADERSTIEKAAGEVDRESDSQAGDQCAEQQKSGISYFAEQANSLVGN